MTKMIDNKCELIQNIDKLHTTELGVERIKVKRLALIRWDLRRDLINHGFAKRIYKSKYLARLGKIFREITIK